jgi:hypothetical protein
MLVKGGAVCGRNQLHQNHLPTCGRVGSSHKPPTAIVSAVIPASRTEEIAIQPIKRPAARSDAGLPCPRVAVLLAPRCHRCRRRGRAAANDAIPDRPSWRARHRVLDPRYSEISTNEGFRTTRTTSHRSIARRSLPTTPQERREAVDHERERIEAMLKRLARGATDLSDDERRLAEIFGSGATAARFADAAANVRFQLGQSDRFREGLERSGAWEQHIAETFSAAGLPKELAALPHVESSFDPTANSKVGAAGLWQFMPGTGRRFLRVNDAVDERLDPYRATEAAAQLLDYNYRLLGSRPLAVTAYNHGASRHAPRARFHGHGRHRDHRAQLPQRRSVSRFAQLLCASSPRWKSTAIRRSISATCRAARRCGPPKGDALVCADTRQAGAEDRLLAPGGVEPGTAPAGVDGRRLVPGGYRLRLPTDSVRGPPRSSPSRSPRDQYVGASRRAAIASRMAIP